MAVHHRVQVFSTAGHAVFSGDESLERAALRTGGGNYHVQATYGNNAAMSSWIDSTIAVITFLQVVDAVIVDPEMVE